MAPTKLPTFTVTYVSNRQDDDTYVCNSVADSCYIKAGLRQQYNRISIKSINRPQMPERHVQANHAKIFYTRSYSSLASFLVLLQSMIVLTFAF